MNELTVYQRNDNTNILHAFFYVCKKGISARIDFFYFAFFFILRDLSLNNARFHVYMRSN